MHREIICSFSEGNIQGFPDDFAQGAGESRNQRYINSLNFDKLSSVEIAELFYAVFTTVTVTRILTEVTMSHWLVFIFCQFRQILVFFVVFELSKIFTCLFVCESPFVILVRNVWCKD